MLDLFVSLGTTGRLIVCFLAAAGSWLLSGAIWPYTRCRACAGAGKFFSPTSTNWRNCPRCGGSGKKTRLAAHLVGRGDR